MTQFVVLILNLTFCWLRRQTARAVAGARSVMSGVYGNRERSVNRTERRRVAGGLDMRRYDSWLQLRRMATELVFQGVAWDTRRRRWPDWGRERAAAVALARRAQPDRPPRGWHGYPKPRS